MARFKQSRSDAQDVQNWTTKRESAFSQLTEQEEEPRLFLSI